MIEFTQAKLDEIEPELIEMRRQLHANPELSHEEFQTTASIRGWLSEKGILLRDFGLPTGLSADIGDESRGPTIALRADIDSLTVMERTGLPYSSKVDGKMCACGHDFHTAALIGAAYLLKDAEHLLPGRIRIIFQPSEETNDGAMLVIKDGQLEGVSAIIGMHNKPDLPVGTVGIKNGPLMAAVDRFHVTLRGKGGHGALPHKVIDPITAAAQLISSLQTIVSRNISPVETAVVSVTRVCGGNTWNVVPDEVVFEGTARSFTPEIRRQIKNRFYKIVEHTAEAFDQNAVIKWIPGPPPVINDPRLVEIANANTAGFMNIVEPAVSGGGEDFAYYQQLIPGLFVFFGVNGTEDWHHPEFTIDESAIILAARFFAYNACGMLTALSKEADKNGN